MKKWLIKYLYCVPNADDVIRIDKDGTILIGGEKITDSMKQKLTEEAFIIKNTELWRLMTESLKDKASRTMFEKSESWVDMLGGKFILYTIDVQKSILNLFHS